MAIYKVETPPPSLQGLVELAGGRWDKITEEMWSRFQTAMDQWKMSVRFGDQYMRGPRPWGYIDEKAKTEKAEFKSWPYAADDNPVNSIGEVVRFDPVTGEVLE